MILSSSGTKCRSNPCNTGKVQETVTLLSAQRRVVATSNDHKTFTKSSFTKSSANVHCGVLKSSYILSDLFVIFGHLISINLSSIWQVEFQCVTSIPFVVVTSTRELLMHYVLSVQQSWKHI